MDQPCSRDELRACLRDVAWLNRVLFGYRPILHWLESLNPTSGLRILDIGSGYGDTLRRIEQWAKGKGIAVQLTGLDLNPDTAVIAAQASPPHSTIRWITGDVFTCQPPDPPHLIISSLMAHHLTDSDVVRFLQWMEDHATHGWFINDLSRRPVPYRLLYAFTRLMRLHPFVQHDGPVSIARAFRPEDWHHYCAAAGLNPRDYTLRGFTPGRLCVARQKTGSRP
ncbi:methyltransferase domain-containing protein [Acidobacteria bacterium AB60]|nr:methyltransferase domain-containing protein [Acidobacteria bacterium AB60]